MDATLTSGDAGRLYGVAALGSVDGTVATDGFELTDVHDGREIPLGCEVFVRGWAASAETLQPLERFEARVAGVAQTSRYGLLRLDVANAYDRRPMIATGFEVTIATRDLGPGEHELRLGGSDGELPPVRLRVGTAGTPYRSVPQRFEATVDRIYDEDPTFARPFSAQRPFVAVVEGRLHDRTGAEPRLARALIDVKRTVAVQLGVRSAESGRTDGFFACFPTGDLDIGKHLFRLYAVSNDGEYSCAVEREFDLVPIAVSGPPPRSPAIAPASIVHVDTGLEARTPRRVARGEVVVLRGWALDPLAMDAPAAIYVEFDDGTQFHMIPRQPRPDIAARFGAPKALGCGFVGSIDTSFLPPGRRTARCSIIAKSDRFWYDTEAEIVLDVD